MSQIKIWLQAFRLRTLPLALANAVMGSFLAKSSGIFRWEVFILAILTIVFLQILSNLANDYGDAVSGKDTEKRVGPQRVTHTGMVSMQAMKRMIIAFVIFSFVTGSALIIVSLSALGWKIIALFFALGIAAIWAALKYTIGENPYGYKGLGDIFVFIFFGPVGVIGTFYLHTLYFDNMALVPAAVIGILSTAVLNINNLRDIDNDRETGKQTLAVKRGRLFAQRYHLLLIGSAIVLSVAFTLNYYFAPTQWLFLLTIPLFLRNCIKVYKNENAQTMNNELKNLALTTFLFSVLFGIGLIIK
ncbi:MAG TPA: 1,4-dihydroxy-2-naphthoate polyprenyltransferase [Prolixibacteraceae bacterium]|nr:1,4-dihydroxy-2-naphthoate polyprenyltransferase [Prolixibacteraceae bacterium]